MLEEQKQTIGLADIESAPNVPAVFLVWPREGEPYLAKTNLLRRRLLRLLRERERPSRLLNLRDVTERIEYWPTGSQLESSLLFYRLARQHFPETYSKLVKLRMPAYVKLGLSNEFPRTSVATRVSGGRNVFYGPFRTRTGAEQFENQFLDLFQIRRCEENLEPRPDHPGCIYGEMNMCLRPCQQVVSRQQYASEVERVNQFLHSGGATLLEKVAASRERCSENLDFEEAARQHKRYEKILQILGLRDELVRDLEKLNGVAVVQAAQPDTVNLIFFRLGWWLDPVAFELGVATGPGVASGQGVSLDRRLREIVLALPPWHGVAAERQEHLALLARWVYSTWRDGEFIVADRLEDLPYRKLVNAIARVVKATQPGLF